MAPGKASLRRGASAADLAAAAAAAAHAPVEITFSAVTFSVTLKSGGRKEILRGVSGAVLPTRLLAIMGSSGAGKTTLLDVLACNPQPGGRAGGAVLVNGAPRKAAAFQRQSCYVLQREVLLASATVREAVVTSALLKLPRALGAERLRRADAVLEELGLTGCRDTLIGDELLGMKGVSGGQRRRVAIGIELVKDPRVLFLDEPTSGLDSEMAMEVVETLRALCAGGRTVALTIHQPNSLITAKFDDFILLAAGRAVFGGAWADAAPFFAAGGHALPPATNPTDFFLAVLQDSAAAEALADRQADRAALAAAAPAPADVEAAGGKGGAGGEDLVPLAVAAAEVPFFYQAWVLMLRYVRSYIRNPAMLGAELAQYLFMGLFVGLMYLQLSDAVSTGVSDRVASIWFALAVLSFTPSYTAATAWDRERVLLRRETGQGLYDVTAWFLARTAVVVPLQILQTILFGLVAYWMVGYAASFTHFLVFLACYAMFQIVSESVGVMCSAGTKSSTAAVLALTFILLILLSFSGFLVSDVPVYFAWVGKISYLTYALAAVVGDQFAATTFYCDVAVPPSAAGGAGCFAGGEIAGTELVPAQVANGLSVETNMLILLGLTLGTRALAFLFIWGAHRLRFL